MRVPQGLIRPTRSLLLLGATATCLGLMAGCATPQERAQEAAQAARNREIEVIAVARTCDPTVGEIMFQRDMFMQHGDEKTAQSLQKLLDSGETPAFRQCLADDLQAEDAQRAQDAANRQAVGLAIMQASQRLAHPYTTTNCTALGSSVNCTSY